MRKAGILQQAADALKPYAEGFKGDYEYGGEDPRRVMHRIRQLENKTAEGPKMAHMLGSWPLAQRVRELFNVANPAGIQARNEADIGLRKDKGAKHVVGQLAGTVAADITQDNSRRFWWLLNALQASGEVVNESLLSIANKASNIAPDLYGKHTVLDPDTGKKVGLTTTRKKVAGQPVQMVEQMEKNSPRAAELGIIKEIEGEYEPARGYSWDNKESEWKKRNFEPGMVASLAIPSGIAINTGLGLMNVTGGAEGYKAALPSEDDVTKTENVLQEVGMKYILGRTGNLLPYNEFSKVRPDVSQDEYNRYQAFKYDKNTDLDPTDGDITVMGGAIKATDEGIHGPELQFLGRGLPVTTGIIPFGSAVAGGMAGVATRKPIKHGFLGGMAGLAAGQIGGNLIEGERRRRNKEENERQYNKGNDMSL
jgi:hypothetical protein